jgi:hypothetical protein
LLKRAFVFAGIKLHAFDLFQVNSATSNAQLLKAVRSLEDVQPHRKLMAFLRCGRRGRDFKPEATYDMTDSWQPRLFLQILEDRLLRLNDPYDVLAVRRLRLPLRLIGQATKV